MKITLAKNYGFCYGVNRAINIAHDAINSKIKVATYGPLIHNNQMTNKLKEEGIGCEDSLENFQANDSVIFRSHGVGPKVYEKAKSLGLNIIDATCPNVKLAQQKAHEFALKNYFVVIIGEKNHPEVKSIKAWAGENSCIIESINDILFVPKNKKYGIIVQTTFELTKFNHLLKELQSKVKGEYVINKTICNATSERQQAALNLAKESDVVFVFGGKHSANTTHLYEIVKEVCPKVYHLETAQELKPEMLYKCQNIGITAGASTPDWIIKEAIVIMESMESLLTEDVLHLRIGMKVNAKIVQITKEDVVVDFGYQSEGSIPFHEWELGATEESVRANYKNGDEITAKVIASENKDGLVVLSKLKALADVAWDQFVEKIKDQKVWTVKGYRVVKGGLVVTVEEGITGFVPASHLELHKVDDLNEYVGKEFEVEVLDFDPMKKRLVLSRRAILREKSELAHKAYEEKKEARIATENEAFKTLEVGEVIKGTIKNITDFGMFVEVYPDVQGLVHNTEVSWDRSKSAQDLFKSGEEVEVKVVKLDPESRRISLSIKALTENPRILAEKEIFEKLEVGEVINGTIKNITNFGMFVEIIPGVQGLVHNTEVSWDRSKSAQDLFKSGEKIEAKVIKLDASAKRISLSVKALTEDPWVVEANKLEEGSVVNGTVVRILDFGAIVKISEKIEGLVHISELSEDRVESVSDVLKVGQNVEVKILKIALDEKKVSLSIAQVAKDKASDDYGSYMEEKKSLSVDLSEQLEGLKD
jgi:4-hydroxy-3-methylbut-2-enyl diphosphate reductase